MRTLAIGDIHGCFKALIALIGEVRPQPEDQLVFLGDYIDRGPDSKAVLDLLVGQQKRNHTVFLRGNHEEMVLDARTDPLEAKLWQGSEGFQTLVSYGAEDREDWATAIPESHWSFLNQTLPGFETPGNIFVHACLDPALDLKDQPDWLLYWEFFDRIQPHKSAKKVICGHSAQRSGRIKDIGFAACIDTGAVFGGWLTCLDVGSGEYWQANEQGETRAGRLRSEVGGQGK
jgi:serine/threonine protein phosphatase 1